MSGVLAQPAAAPAQMQIQQVIDKMATLFGGVKGLLTSNDLARKPGQEPVNDYNVVDANYKDRYLATLSTMATAAMMNQFWGQPLVAVCTQIVLSWERQWSVQFDEIYQWAWSETSATGIPHTVQYRTWKEVGGSNRYAQYFELPNALLVDPNFGMQSLLALSKGMKQTYEYTIITKTAMALAMAPMRNLMKKLHAENRVYTYAEHFDFTTRDFGLGALHPSHLISVIDRALTTMPYKDTVIVPEGHAHTLEGITQQGERHLYHVEDSTDNSILAGLELKNLYTEPIAALTINGSKKNLIICPSLMSTNPEAEQHREQALRRQVTLARAYNFQPRQYGSLAALDARALAVPVLNIDYRNASWELITLKQTIEETLCGGYFSNVDGDYSPDFMKYVYDLNGVDEGSNVTNSGAMARLSDILSDLEGARDLDHPGPNAMGQIHDYQNSADRLVSGGMDRWREISPFVHIERSAAGAVRRAATNQYIIQQHEAMYRTQDAIQQARSVIGMGTDAKRYLAGIVGCSQARADDLLKVVSKYDITFDGKQVEQSIALYRALLGFRGNITQTLSNQKAFTKNADYQAKATAAATAATAAAGVRAATRPTVNSVSISAQLPWAGKIANQAFDVLAPFFGTLEKLAAQDATVAKEVNATIETRFAAHLADAGSSEVVAKHVAGKLTEMGLGADALAAAATVPVPTPEQLKAFKRSIPSVKDLAAGARAGLEADFSNATAFAASGLVGAPFARPITTAATPEEAEHYVEDEAARLKRLDDGIAPSNIDDITDALLKGANLTPADAHKNVYIPSDRLLAMQSAFDGCSADETLVAMALLVTRMTPRDLSRLASFGIQIVQASVERYSEQYIVSSMLVMKAGVETVQTVMTPVQAQVTSRGIQKTMLFDYTFDMGHRFLNWDGIQEIFGVFPYALAGGTGTLLCRSTSEVREIFAPTSRGRTARPLVAIFRPYTERRLEYPGNLFGTSDVRAQRSYSPETFFHRKNTGHAVLRGMLGRDFIEEVSANLETSVMTSHTMMPNPYCPFVERAATYYFNEMEKTYCNQESGTGCLGPMKFNNYEWVSTVFGAGRGTFPDTWPTRANVA